jgi:hypothetical protein
MDGVGDSRPSQRGDQRGTSIIIAIAWQATIVGTFMRGTIPLSLLAPRLIGLWAGLESLVNSGRHRENTWCRDDS